MYDYNHGFIKITTTNNVYLFVGNDDRIKFPWSWHSISSFAHLHSCTSYYSWFELLDNTKWLQIVTTSLHTTCEFHAEKRKTCFLPTGLWQESTMRSITNNTTSQNTRYANENEKTSFAIYENLWHKCWSHIYFV